MEDISLVSALLHKGTIVLGLAVFIVTFFIRRTLETRWPSLKKLSDANAPGITYATSMSRWWNEVILYLIPVTLGCLASLSHDPFLFGPVESHSAQFMIGGGVAWFSSTIYKIIRKLFADKFGITNSMMPPAD